MVFKPSPLSLYGVNGDASGVPLRTILSFLLHFYFIHGALQKISNDEITLWLPKEVHKLLIYVPPEDLLSSSIVVQVQALEPEAWV